MPKPKLRSRKSDRVPAPPKKKEKAVATRAPRHTTPIEEHPGYDAEGVPTRSYNGPRPQDPKQNISQDPALDYAAFSSPEHGVLGTDEEL